MPTRQDEEFVRQTVKQFYAQKGPKHYLVKLPCHQVNIEVPEGHEGYMECPECHQKYMITNNMINKRLYAEDNYEHTHKRKHTGRLRGPIIDET